MLARWWIPGVHEGGKVWQIVHAWLVLRRRHYALVLDYVLRGRIIHSRVKVVDKTGIRFGQNVCDRKYHDVTLAPAAAGRKTAPAWHPNSSHLLASMVLPILSLWHIGLRLLRTKSRVS